MDKGISGSPKQVERDDKSFQSTTDDMEESRSEGDTGPDTQSRQSNPNSPGLEVSESAQTGALVTLLSKISAPPIEVVRALEEFRSMIDERVLGPIGAFRREFTACMNAHDATVKARLDALDAKFDSIRREVRIILVVATLLLALSGALVYLGFVDRSNVRSASTPATHQQVQAPIPDAEEQTPPTGDSVPGTFSASEDVSGPNGDTPDADGSSLPTDP